MRHDRLPGTDPDSGATFAVIETPRGSRSKYDYDAKLQVFRVAALLPLGMVFPYDFGFIHSTKAEDGDPLDIMIVMDEAAPPGTLVTVRVLGAIEAEQRKEDEAWIRNDRLISVATHAHTHTRSETLKDLDPHIVVEIEAFFQQYNKFKGRIFA